MISIITVVRNGIETIEDSILSVINQKEIDFEYIIIDGGSTDGTLDIINKYSDKITTIISEPDKGIYDAMNKGIKFAMGDWIYFLGSDDVFFSDTILKILFSNETANYDVVYGNVIFKNTKIIYSGEFDYDKLCVMSPCHQAIFYRRDLFEKFGLFSIDYKTASDYVLHVKTFCGGAKWKFFDTIIAIYNEDGASSDSYKDKLFHANLYKICYDNFNPYVSKLTLSRLFYSTYPRFAINHEYSISSKYLFMTIKKIGLFTLFINFFILLYKFKIKK